MKRIFTLFMTCAMLLGTGVLANAAVEFKASGHMHIIMGVKDNGQNGNVSGFGAMSFNKDAPEDNFYAMQRFRPRLTMKAEGVTAVFEVQQQQAYWGSDWPVGGNPEVSTRIRQAFIDFKLPGTPVGLKVGYQQLNLPGIWDNSILTARHGAVLATIPFSDQVKLNVFYSRPADKLNKTGYTGGTPSAPSGAQSIQAAPSHNSTDILGVILPLSFGGVKAIPYFLYGKIGDMAIVDNYSASVGGKSWNNELTVGGAHFDAMPANALSVKVDAAFTNVDSDEGLDIGLGWYAGAAIDYKASWGTPGFFAWYMSGADKDGEGYFYSIKTSGFLPTSLGFQGADSFDVKGFIGNTGVGSMGVGLQIADMSWVDSLKHTVCVAYIQGTSDKDYAGVGYDMLSEDWKFYEVNFDSTWSLYESLSISAELGGIVPDTNNEVGKDDFAWRAQLFFKYSF